jgi:exonuclease SbcD
VLELPLEARLALEALARRLVAPAPLELLDGHLPSDEMVVDEEHRQVVDRDAIGVLFAGAAEVKMEGRVLPAVRSRAEGISRAASLSEKITRWGELTQVDTNPLLDRLSMVSHAEPQAIADLVLQQLDNAGASNGVAALTVPEVLPEPTDDTEPPVRVARAERFLEEISAPPQAAMDWLSDDLFAEVSA